MLFLFLKFYQLPRHTFFAALITSLISPMHRHFLSCFTVLLLTVTGCGGQANSNPEQESNTSKPQRVNGPNTQSALPKPFATPPSSRSSTVIGWKTGQKPVAPSGFTVQLFSKDVSKPRWIYQLPGNDILVAESAANRISLFRDTNGDGLPDMHEILLDHTDMPFGMLYLNNYLYVATESAVTRYRYKPGETKINGKGEIITSLPEGGHHWTRNIIANSTGSKIFVAVGSATDHAEDGIEKELNRACILQMNPDGSGRTVYASGLRNPVGMDLQPGTDQLWTAVNERDQLGDDLPPDYLTSVQRGGFYGWPYSYYGNNLDPRIKAEDQKPELVQKAIIPDVPLGSHTASLGLAFYDRNAFPSKYHNGAFIGQHGSWNRSELTGYRVAFVPFVNNKPGKPEDFLAGFIADKSSAKVYGRPVGVTVLTDGSLLVADDGGNAIWRVTYNKK